MERLAVLELLAKEFNHNIDKVTPDTTFEELGMDSYEVVDFIAKSEEYYNTMIDNETALQAKTIQDVLNALTKQAGGY